MSPTFEINDDNTYKFFNKLAYEDNNPLKSKISKDANTRKQVLLGFNVHTYIDIHKYVKNLKLIYDNDAALKSLNMINDMQIIFNKYFKIIGLERLVATNYTDIEWPMFLEHNFDKSEPQRTRDHFIHQFRNAYLGCTLLHDFSLDKIIIECIKEKQTTFSYIINKAIEAIEIEHELEEKDKDNCLNQIIYKSYILSAIFHDIGYPISYFNRVSSQIHKFTPFYEIVNCNTNTDFTKIKSLLADSILFLTVDNDEIRKKYEENDHGVFSAISFLLNFYSSGSIYSISEIDRCIIELAAIAIYNHTNKYGVNERMVFYNDPISYILRLCDDLQEWSRFSLKIDNNNNFLRCNKCLGIMRKVEASNEYKCNFCGISFDKITQIEYKKINHIEFCRGISIKQSEDDMIIIEVDFDPYILLELLVNDYLAVNFRDKDMNKVEQMLEFQKKLPIINLNWKLSNNPYVLVKWILDRKGISIEDISADVLVKIKGLENHESICKEFVDELIKLKESEFGDKKILMDAIKYHSRAKEFVFKYIGVIEYINNCKSPINL